MSFAAPEKCIATKKGDVFDDVNTPAADREITDFTVRELSCDTVLATYKIIQNHKTPNQKTYSLRSPYGNALTDSGNHFSSRNVNGETVKQGVTRVFQEKNTVISIT